MTDKHKNRSQLNSLNLQIYAAEQQLVQRRLRVSKLSSRLLCHVQQRITEPASLLLAGGVGFMFAELTKHEPQKKTSSSIKHPVGKATSVLNILLSCIAFMHELYAALPLILIAKAYFDSNNLNHPLENRHATDAENVALVPTAKQFD
jgi:hypothetical protein